LVPEEIKPDTLQHYQHVCRRIARSIGHRIIDSLTYDDFSQLRSDLSKGKAVTTLQNQLIVARMVMGHAVENGYKLAYKKALKAPAARVLRARRHEKGPQDFTRDQLRSLLDYDEPFRAVILVGINLAYGPSDIAQMPTSVLGDFVDWPRPKSAVDRRGWLWPETREALGDPQGRLVFSWSRRLIAYYFSKRLAVCGITGRGFYGLRKTFSTVASDTGNAFAVNRVMGHAERDVPSLYRQRISDDQIRRVCEYVREWLI
jgi:integrase